MVHCDLNVGLVSIPLPVSHTIANDNTLKVEEELVLRQVLLVVVMNSISKIRNVNPGIRLTSYI